MLGEDCSLQIERDCCKLEFILQAIQVFQSVQLDTKSVGLLIYFMTRGHEFDPTNSRLPAEYDMQSDSDAEGNVCSSLLDKLIRQILVTNEPTSLTKIEGTIQQTLLNLYLSDENLH
jgi:hypothetical protein